MEEIKIHQFAEKLELLGYSRRCIADYPYAVGRFFSYLNEKEGLGSIEQVTPQHITAYHTYLQFGRTTKGQHLASRTITTLLGPLKTFYQVMHREHLVPCDFSACIVPPKRRMQLPRNVPSVESVLTLLESANGNDLLSVRDRCILELLYATGIRNQELRTLTLDAYNTAEGTLLIKGKGSKDRIVPVGWWTVAYLNEYVQSTRPKLIKAATPLLFVTRRGKMLARNVVGYIVVKYAKRAGINKVTPHTLRHACATHLLHNGADIRYVQELLGHACLSSTQIYTRVDISLLKKAHTAYHPREQMEYGSRNT